jgi:hypothetical protein
MKREDQIRKVKKKPDGHPGLVGQVSELHLAAAQHGVCSVSVARQKYIFLKRK